MRVPTSANIKIGLLIVALLIVIGTLWYTQRVVRQLLIKEREVADLYAKSLQYIASSPAEQADYSFIFDEVVRAIDFPIILTDADNNPIPPYLSNARNIAIDTSLSQPVQEKTLREIIARLDTENPPIKVTVQTHPKNAVARLSAKGRRTSADLSSGQGPESITLQIVHYGESSLITRLRWLPYIEIGIAGIFILVGYVGFSYIKRSEQSNIWVGMARETAHQLGTPLSSIMGWVELLKVHSTGKSKLQETVGEMENDLTRLQKIADRFSKIGSKTVLKEENLAEVISSVIRYFERRLPQKQKNIEMRIVNDPASAGKKPSTCPARINRELFEWVIENLVKNALDAMGGSSGTITFSLAKKGSDIIIDVADTGKGIDMKYRQDIFRPGYSTKERGWGLGLSLSKRIVETYHRGKLTLRESKIGKGTTFRIKLRG